MKTDIEYIAEKLDDYCRENHFDIKRAKLIFFEFDPSFLNHLRIRKN